jgi:plasmid stabilization system protein ParE
LAELEFTGPAAQDLANLRSRVATDSGSTSRAQAFIERIQYRCETLRMFPLAGRARPEFIPPGFRSLPVRPVIVFYRYFEERNLVRIERVIDGRRDLGTIFAEDV